MKRVITCSDGTWNKPGETVNGQPIQTNVERMFNAITEYDIEDRSIIQRKFYGSGVGTGYTWQDRVLGGATGLGIDKNIKDIYLFICLNYEPGDHIYLFGFSRGAYTARSLAGFIRNCGILKTAYIHLLDKAYDMYRDRNSYSKPDSDLMVSFRKSYCKEDNTKIEFIGVWDTVGSLGIPLPSWKLRNMHKYKFHDQTLSKYVRHAYHAIAIDERRRLFEPTLWQKIEETDADQDASIQELEQRWFPGVHSNVGGGYPDTGLSDIALKWLMEKSQKTGLSIDEKEAAKIKANANGMLYNSYTAPYWFWFPKYRKIALEDKTLCTSIDDTVKERYKLNPKYRPTNLTDYFKQL